MVLRRHPRILGLVALGYAAGAAGYFWLPGPLSASDPDFWSRPSARILQILLAFLLPTTAAVIYGVVRVVWSRDSVRDSDEPFEATYEPILFATVTFVIAIHLMVLGTLTGLIPPVRTILIRATIVLFGLLIVRAGNLLPRTRPNLAIGVRTPRTLASREVWMHTNRAAGYVAVALGLVFVVAGALFEKALMERALGLAIPIALTAFLICVYKYTSTAQRI